MTTRHHPFTVDSWVRVRQAAPGEVPDVARLVAVAFEPLDVCGWLVGDHINRRSVLSGYLLPSVLHALSHGVVDVVDGPDGVPLAVGVWFNSPCPPVPGHDALLAETCGPWADNFRALEEAMDGAHPIRPHAHLAFMAVRPDHQGQGLGGALLDHRHAVLDTTGRPAYLEAANARGRTLYLRHGYHDAAPAFTLPYPGEQPRPMWRPAADTAPTGA